VETVDVDHELLVQKDTQAQSTAVRVEDIYTTIYASVAGGPCEKQKIEGRRGLTAPPRGKLK
jgi:hypothetical protein